MTDSIHHIPAVEGESPAEGHLISLFSNVFTRLEGCNVTYNLLRLVNKKNKELVKTKAQEDLQ